MEKACSRVPTVPPYMPRKGAAETDFDTAAAWWKHRPILRGDLGRERVIAFSTEGGLKGSPSKTGASLVLLYERGPRTAESASQYELLDAGSVVVGHDFYGPSDTPQYADEIWTTQQVEVRGRPARLFEGRKKADGNGTNIMWIRWEEAVAGGVVQHSVTVSPAVFSPQEAVTLANELQAVR